METWGSALDHEIEKSQEGAKNSKEADRKAKAVLDRYLSSGSRKTQRKFRDPLARG